MGTAQAAGGPGREIKAGLMADFEADIIVVGGGSAGAAMAGRLAESGRYSVLLLEAGRSDRHPFTRIPAANIHAVQNPEFDWCMKAEPDPSIGNRSETWSAAKVLGGGSSINGMMFIRGHAWDYDRWAELGATGWDYKSVLPFFKRMETNEAGGDDFRGDRGPLRVSENRANYPITQSWIEAVQEAGIARCADLNGRTCSGVDRVQVSQHKGWRHSSARAYLRSPPRNLRIELKARALRIEFEGKTARAVRFERDGSEHSARARCGIVVSCGTVNSARLLLLSGIGPAADLRGLGIAPVLDLPGVGRNLQDHVGAHLSHRVRGTTLNVETKGLRALRHALNFFGRGRGALTTSIGHAQAFVRTRPDLPAPNIQLIFAPFAFEHDEQGRIQLLGEPAAGTMIAVQRPKSRGTVTLRSADPMDNPIIRHQLLGDEGDLDELIEGFAMAREIMTQPAMAQHVIDEAAPGAAVSSREALTGYIRDAAISMYHPVGTCRIGIGEDCVVGPSLAVRGVQRLWVADASVMPTIPSGNTNATSIMIGDKGASHVLSDLDALP